ncbi:hypothetical protein Vretimale_14896, partial [Volvox reticuliferus]
MEEALRGSSVSTMPMQPHPAGDRLAAVLYDSTPQLPGTLPPPPEEQSDQSLSPTPPIESSEWALYELGLGPNSGGAGGMKCLSTITEESSGVLLRTTVSNLDRPAGSTGSGGGAAASDASGQLPSGTSMQAREMHTDPWVSGEPWITADPRGHSELGPVTAIAPATVIRLPSDPWVDRHGRRVTQEMSYNSSHRRTTASSGGGTAMTSEGEQEQEQEAMMLAATMDPQMDSLGTVEEGDEEAALAEKSEEVTRGSGAAAAGDVRRTNRQTNVFARKEKTEEEEQGDGRPLLPPLRLSGHQIISPVGSSRPSTSGIISPSTSLPLPPLRLPSATPSSRRRRPHSSCGLPAADAAAAAAAHVAEDFMPPFLQPRPPLRRASLTASLPPIAHHIRTSGGQPAGSSSTVQSFYTDISLAASMGIPAAAAAAATVDASIVDDTILTPPPPAVAGGRLHEPDSSYRRPRSADAASGGGAAARAATGNRIGGRYGSDSASGSLLIYTDDGGLSPDLTHLLFDNDGSMRVDASGQGAGGGGAPNALDNGGDGGGFGAPSNYPYVRHLFRSPATSTISEGLVPLPEFASDASAELAAAEPLPPTSFLHGGVIEHGATGSGSGTGSRFGLGSGFVSRSGSEDGGEDVVIMEAQGASLDCLAAAGHRPRRQMLR